MQGSIVGMTDASACGAVGDASSAATDYVFEWRGAVPDVVVEERRLSLA